MTDKPPVPSDTELREMRRQAVAYYWADGYFADWVETGEITDRHDSWDKDLEPLYELLQKQWLAGYRARDAEVAKAEDFVTATQKDNESLEHCLEVKVTRIAELEAEVAELRKRAAEPSTEELESRYESAAYAAEGPMTTEDAHAAGLRAVAAGPYARRDSDGSWHPLPGRYATIRRTPELTERVAAKLYFKDFGLTHEDAEALTEEILDLVFGKGQE